MSEEFTGTNDGLNANSLKDIEELPDLPEVKAFSAVPSSDESTVELLDSKKSAEAGAKTGIETNAKSKSSKDSSLQEDDADEFDPLLKRPRVSTILWCVAPVSYAHL